MSEANYNASSHDHAEILICVQSAGNLQESELNAALDKIKRHAKITIADAGRTVYFRFEIDSSPDNSKWGFFQPHRRVMGLIMLAGCSTAMDVALLHETFQKKKEAFADYIFDARCFVFGIDSALYLQQSKAEVFQFVDVQSWKLSDRDIKEFLTSVFYVLESKRLQMAADKSDRPPLLTAPFEKSQSNSSDSDSRSFRKKCLGRWKKHLADVNLLAGLKMEALQNYHTALDMLVSVNDQVWIGGVLEGLCVASAIIVYPCSKTIPKSPVIKSNEKQVLDPRNLISSKLAGSPSNADLMKYCIQAPEDFVDRYKEAVINYSRSMHLGIVELEACIKATKVMAVMNKSMQAAEFLQNAVYISLKVSEQERITKYSVLADLYAEINFHRKSAFYRRVAAMQCVAPQLEQANWNKCYTLLQGTFQGYSLEIHTDSGVPSNNSNDSSSEFGWPQVRLRVLYELVFSSRRIGNNKIANRYMAYLLMRMHQHLTDAEEKEACTSLESYNIKNADMFKFTDGQVLPPLHLYNLPTASNVSPRPLTEHLQPSVQNTSQSKASVFLFMPLSYQSAQNKHQHIDFKWCVNTPAEVRIRVHNPLRVNCLRVSDFKLICKSEKSRKPVDCHTVTLDIPANANVEATLVVIPKVIGTITIIGYEASVFGFHSRCLFQNMPWITVDEFEVDITPEIPVLLKESSFLPSGVGNDRNNLSVTVYPGEKRILLVPFNNTSSVSVTHVDVQAMSPIATNVTSQFKSATSAMNRLKVDWLDISCSDVQEELPVEPEKSLLLPVVMKAYRKSDDSIIDNLLTCSCQVRMKYSGSSALEQNWCRNTAIQITSTLKPCINVINMNIRCASRQAWCLVTLEIANISNEFVRVLSAKLTGDNLKSGNTQVKFDYEGGHLVLANLKPDDTKILRFEIPTSITGIETSSDKSMSLNLAQSSGRSETQKEKLQEKLSNDLALEWRVADGELLRSGILDVSSYSLSKESIISLVRPPLHWEINVRDRDVTVKQECYAAVGEPCPIKIQIENTSDHEIPLVDVELEIFQDQCNGFREWNMEDCVLCVGCQCQSFYNVKVGERVDFECTLVFLLIGQYYVRLRRISPHRGSIYELWKGELKRTISNPTNQELYTYREFSPHVIITADSIDD